jgi:predicted dehydrogenase
MEATNNVGIVIVGAAGDRGGAALEILPKLRAEESTQGINLELVCLAEAKEDSHVGLGSRVAALLGSPCQVVGMLVEAIPHVLRWLANGHGQRKLIVYDATPTAHHYLHLMSVLPHTERERIYYFGEKPLFTEQGQIEFIERNFAGQTFFCDLIETENPAFRATNEFIRAERFDIQRMFFWRASCMGVSIAAGDGRGGVEGGALLDKAPHDLSVAVGLLEPRNLMQSSVSQVGAHLLTLHESAFQRSSRNFLSVSGTSIQDISSPVRLHERWPAVALVSFDVDFALPGNVTVPVSFIASWLGIQNTHPELRLCDKLASLGIDEKEWLNSEEPRTSGNQRYRYANEEIRVALIEGLLSGRKVHLVLNLLSKFEGRRFVYLLGEDRQREIIFEEENASSYHEKKDADLLRIFQRVVEHCAGLSTAENVGTESTLLVHKIMLSAAMKANEQLRTIDQDQAYKASLRAYRKYLAPVDTSRRSPLMSE